MKRKKAFSYIFHKKEGTKRIICLISTLIFLCLVELQEFHGDLALSSSPQLLLDALDIISIQEQVDNMAAKYRLSNV